ncbi:MAG: hypothetical protein EBY39_13185 [Flavobacteriia bacterium]|nr:hypothetical protein [Flavobacteriia bacterium]
MTDDNQAQSYYRNKLVDGIYNKHLSNKELLVAEIHRHLEYPEVTCVDKLDSALIELAKENQVLYLLDKLFTPPEQPSSENSEAVDQTE